MLAEDQKQTVKEIKDWYGGSKAYHTLSGSAGTGKTFVLDKILKELPRIQPVLLAPTHKALGQLRNKIKGAYDFRTVANSLGIRPVDEGKGLKFTHTKIPSFWETVNLAVVDECGMLDESHLALFKSIGMKILYVGHKSQLPPVKPNRSMFDKCVSPVFEQNYGASTLYIPKRNTGKLWEFNNILEQRIYDLALPEPKDYDFGRAELHDYVVEEAFKDIQSGKTKFALWTNDGVTRYNDRIRKVIFGAESAAKYLPGDLVIVTNSFTSFDGMELMSDRMIISFEKSGLDVYTDTDGVVIFCKEVTINLSKALHVECYKLEVQTDVEGKIVLYELKHVSDYKKIADYYEHIAWQAKTKEYKDKLYRERATILHCFAKLKHFYAATSHRLQGSSVPNIVCIASDINKNSNKVERAKCMYVACSRSIDNLMIYRGI